MLKALTVENIAVAKELNIEFDDCFTVLTGQTGTGKSIIISAISLILGAKANKDLIRSGEDSACVTAIFDGTPNTECYDENGEAVFERKISIDGKSSTKINGKSVSLSNFSEAGSKLISLHGQKETSLFYNKNEYIKFLDNYADDYSVIAEYREIFDELTKKKNEYNNLSDSLKEKSERIDILKYQISEIDKAKINSSDEEEKLEKLKIKLKNLEQISKNSSFIYRVLAPSEKGTSVPYLLEASAQALRRLSDVLENAEEMATRLDSYRMDVMDIAEEAYRLLDDDVKDPEKQLDAVETRLALFSRLKRKYGGSLEDILDFRRAAGKKLSDLESGDSRLEEINDECNKLEEEAKIKASLITKLRKNAAKRLSDDVMSVLKYLDMPKVYFFVEVSPSENAKLSITGADDVDFTIVTNPGDAPRSLSLTASGGELSRIMLALRCAMARKTGANTVVFDEIDTGISGSTSEKIGIKLSELAKTSQVICVTHSAQVSAHSDCHILVEKNEVNGRLESSARVIEGEEIIKEIARIIGGINVTEQQYEAARDLINNKNNLKECE